MLLQIKARGQRENHGKVFHFQGCGSFPHDSQADKYRLAGQPIHLIGVEFSRKQRCLVGFEVESLQKALRSPLLPGLAQEAQTRGFSGSLPLITTSCGISGKAPIRRALRLPDRCPGQGQRRAGSG